MIKFLKLRKNKKNNKLNNEKRGQIEKRILIGASLNETDILDVLRTNLNGLESKVARERGKEQKNEISKNRENLIIKSIKAFINPFTLVLCFLACVSFITDFLLSAKEERNLTTVFIISSMVLISGILKIIQEGKSSKAGESLKSMIKTTATARRDGVDNEIDIKDLVVGDIVSLAAGDMIPADVRILCAKDLFISESAMTGESEAIEKFSEADLGKRNILKCKNIAFMGTNVISGCATAVVVAIGDDTMIGSIAETITSQRELTSFDKGVNSVSAILIKFMMVMVPIVFFINGITKGDWINAFLFGISIAVGLTPEMLPMIVTTNLAKGSVNMAKRKAIVKNLNSIQNLGAIDVLCTDKTGTLTEDKIILEKYLNISGEEDIRVLRHAYLVSAFQTGLRNLLDRAILDHAHKDGLKYLEENYTKIDEIPFDFSRRRMSVILKDKNEKKQLISKGAVEEMISISKYAEFNGEIIELNDKINKKIIDISNKLNEEGMRVIAVAQKNYIKNIDGFTIDDEKDMVLIGYIAFLDPAKKTAKEAINLLMNYGIDIKVLTGDNDKVAKSVCKQVNIDSSKVILGEEIEILTDKELEERVDKAKVFAKLSPAQKERIIKCLKNKGHVVGFMGDGINDAPAMRMADVSISVDTAVDIAKESADVILLEKDLTVLGNAVIEGRKTFANIIKYIKMTASSNFGNMSSVLIASAFLPFLPMMASQILILNLIYDISCIAIPWDNVDNEYLKKPRAWDASSIGSFMKFIGPVSSIFDIATYIIMYFIICPLVVGSNFNDPNTNKILFIAVFNAGWFIESLWSQTFVVHMIRTEKIPFIESKASKQVIISTSIAILIGTIIPFTGLGQALALHSLPIIYFIYLAIIIAMYMILITVVKTRYIKKYKTLL